MKMKRFRPAALALAATSFALVATVSGAAVAGDDEDCYPPCPSWMPWCKYTTERPCEGP